MATQVSTGPIGGDLAGLPGAYAEQLDGAATATTATTATKVAEATQAAVKATSVWSKAFGGIVALAALTGLGYAAYTQLNSSRVAVPQNEDPAADAPAELTRMQKVQAKVSQVAEAAWTRVKNVGYFLATPFRKVGKFAYAKGVQVVAAAKAAKTWVCKHLPTMRPSN